MGMIITSIILMCSVVSLFSCIERPYEPGETTGPGGFAEITGAGVTFQYRVIDSGQNLECILSATATGWVAVGFGTGSIKDGGNIIIGYISGGTVYIQDEMASGWAHSVDSQQDLANVSGTESGGVTELRFTIPLDSGDSEDIALIEGNNYYVYLAYSSADDFTTSHGLDRAVVPITF